MTKIRSKSTRFLLNTMIACDGEEMVLLFCKTALGILDATVL